MARIEKRGKRWRARVFPGGRERSKTFDRKADAERWAKTQEADVARGQWVDPSLGRVTFAKWVTTWQAGLHDLRESTLDLNLGVVRNHLLPRFGASHIAEITTADVKAMIADDLLAGYSGSAGRRHVFVLRQILAAAMEDGRLGRNVAAGVRLPPERSRPMRFLTAEQLAQLAAAIRPEHYRPLVLSAGWVGLRWGELAGLTVDRVDMLRRTVTVDRQLTEVGGRVSVGLPKTGAGIRTVSVPASVVDVLAEHFAMPAVESSGLAFPTASGRPMRRSNFRKTWRKAAATCFTGTEHDGLVFHELRHTAAALAIAHGAHPLTIKERLGHSSITVTMDTYGHLFPAQDAALADAMDTTARESLIASALRNEERVIDLHR
jgi:integrase